MLQQISRYDAKRQIRAEILARLEAEIVANGRLDGVKTVADGERVRSIPELPGVFLIREGETVTQERIHETIDYELSLLAIVTNDDPEEGLDEAEKWSAEATAVVLADRHLGLDFVNDAKFVRGIPVSGAHTEGRRSGSVSVITVTFTILPS